MAIMKILLLILILGSGHGKRQPDASCDLLELNHFYSDNGKHAYDQFILYDWCPQYRRHNVVAWVIPGPLDWPVKRGEWWVMKWNYYEGDKNVRARMFIETHSMADPERLNRKLHDERLREGLRK